jgi:hypothetical protein
MSKLVGIVGLLYAATMGFLVICGACGVRFPSWVYFATIVGSILFALFALIMLRTP